MRKSENEYLINMNKISCPHCKQVYSLNEKNQLKQIKCPQCSGLFRTPKLVSPVAAAPARPPSMPQKPGAAGNPVEASRSKGAVPQQPSDTDDLWPINNNAPTAAASDLPNRQAAEIDGGNPIHQKPIEPSRLPWSHSISPAPTEDLLAPIKQPESTAEKKDKPDQLESIKHSWRKLRHWLSIGPSGRKEKFEFDYSRPGNKAVVGACFFVLVTRMIIAIRLELFTKFELGGWFTIVFVVLFCSLALVVTSIPRLRFYNILAYTLILIAFFSPVLGLFFSAVTKKVNDSRYRAVYDVKSSGLRPKSSADLAKQTKMDLDKTPSSQSENSSNTVANKSNTKSQTKTDKAKNTEKSAAKSPVASKSVIPNSRPKREAPSNDAINARIDKLKSKSKLTDSQKAELARLTLQRDLNIRYNFRIDRRRMVCHKIPNQRVSHRSKFVFDYQSRPVTKIAISIDSNQKQPVVDFVPVWDNDLEYTVEAKPGYAVGGLRLVQEKESRDIKSIQFVFMKIEGRLLNPNDKYHSDWFGSLFDRDRCEEIEVLTIGQYVVGFYTPQDNTKDSDIGIVIRVRR